MATAAVLAIIFSAPLSERLFDQGATRDRGEPASVSEVAGFSGIGSVGDYLVVVNVLPGEQMFSTDEALRELPRAGELVLSGQGTEVVTDSRHVEAHIYDRHSGLIAVNIVPVIEVFAQGSGEAYLLESVVMHDVILGPTDTHFGDNVVISGDTELTIRVDLGSAGSVVVDGYLD